MVIISPRQAREVLEYHLEFYYKTLDGSDACFSFPATADGKLDYTCMSDEMKENYKQCIQHTETFLPAEFKTYAYTYTEPAVGRCHCGREVLLEDMYMGATQCECGQWYNLFGQPLKDPAEWMEDF